MVSFIGMLTLVHPFATTWHFPSRGNEKFRGAFLLFGRPTILKNPHAPGVSLEEACHWILSCLAAPYSTAITDSLDSQVAHAPLRIQFAGVTPVPLPPHL